MRLVAPLLALALVVLVAYAPPSGTPPAAAGASADTTQWVNLQILPDSLSRDELTGIMRGFTDALGVKCGHCHVREKGSFDFPSDANAHKEVARGMMRMTRQINYEILPAIDGLGHDGPPMVTCATCHRGAANPAASMGDAHDHEEGGDHN